MRGGRGLRRGPTVWYFLRGGISPESFKIGSPPPHNAHKVLRKSLYFFLLLGYRLQKVNFYSRVTFRPKNSITNILALLKSNKKYTVAISKIGHVTLDPQSFMHQVIRLALLVKIGRIMYILILRTDKNISMHSWNFLKRSESFIN